MRLTPRKRLFVDPKVQGALMFRVVMYWWLCISTIALLLLAWNIINAPDGTFLSFFRFDLLWNQYGAVMVAAIVLLPIMLLDVLQISNRFVGPLFRMRRSLRALAAGEYVAPIRFRKNDFGLELADEFNAVAARVESLKRQIAVLGANQSPPSAGEQLEPAAHGRA
jgi:hypothetical protein